MKSDEARAKAQTMVGDGLVVIPLEVLEDIYERFLSLNHLGQAFLQEWAEMPDDVITLKRAIFAQSDFGAVFAGQFLPKELCDAVRERVRARQHRSHQ